MGNHAGADGTWPGPSHWNTGRSGRLSGGRLMGLRLRRSTAPPKGTRSHSSGRKAAKAASAMKYRRSAPPVRQLAAAHRLMPRWWLIKQATGWPPLPVRPGVRSRAS